MTQLITNVCLEFNKKTTKESLQVGAISPIFFRRMCNNQLGFSKERKKKVCEGRKTVASTYNLNKASTFKGKNKENLRKFGMNDQSTIKKVTEWSLAEGKVDEMILKRELEYHIIKIST